MTSTILDPSNLGPLYFDKNFEQRSIEPCVSDVFEIVLVDEHRGRGLIAKKDIASGHCLFVIPPTVSVNVDEAFKRWMGSSGTKNAESLEKVAETCLIDSMLATVKEARNSGPSLAVAISNSFLALEGNNGKENLSIPSLNVLLAKENNPTYDDLLEKCDEESLLQIVRRNAFGPDFVTFSAMVQNHKATSKTAYRPHRMLGLYPLADMINHSCNPNALRVFVGETMVVHASTSIKAGEEIFLSYVPPTYPYPERQSILNQNHGFESTCKRSSLEAAFWLNPPSKVSDLVALQQNEFSTHESQQELIKAIDFLEKDLLPAVKPNELQRYIRLGFTQLYLKYLNHVLVTKQVSDEELLRLCMQIHFGFVSCGNASTEHLSVLHLCYELIGKIHTHSSDQSKTLPKLRFWTEQVKQACMTRYGSMGQDIQIVRRMMQHTRTVLRTRDGMTQSEYPFI